MGQQAAHTRAARLHHAGRKVGRTRTCGLVVTVASDRLVAELDPLLQKRDYEANHWDAVIVGMRHTARALSEAPRGYREIERSRFTSSNFKVIKRILEQYPEQLRSALQAVHILDLAETGYIKPHVDNVKFSGDLLSGLSLLSPTLMDLIHEETKETITAFLPPRSLYIQTPEGRYQVRLVHSPPSSSASLHTPSAQATSRGTACSTSAGAASRSCSATRCRPTALRQRDTAKWQYCSSLCINMESRQPRQAWAAPGLTAASLSSPSSNTTYLAASLIDPASSRSFASPHSTSRRGSAASFALSMNCSYAAR